jgi:hypothetical protein
MGVPLEAVWTGEEGRAVKGLVDLINEHGPAKRDRSNAAKIRRFWDGRFP